MVKSDLLSQHFSIFHCFSFILNTKSSSQNHSGNMDICNILFKAHVSSYRCVLTITNKILLLHIWDIEAPHLGGGHALGEGSQTSSGPEPIGEPGQVAVTVEVVGV